MKPGAVQCASRAAVQPTARSWIVASAPSSRRSRGVVRVGLGRYSDESNRPGEEGKFVVKHDLHLLKVLDKTGKHTPDAIRCKHSGAGPLRADLAQSTTGMFDLRRGRRESSPLRRSTLAISRRRSG